MVSNHCNFNAICDIKILSAFLPLCACQSSTNGSNLYDLAKYVILLVKVKVVLNTELEPSMTLLTSTTHFQVLVLEAQVLGLEAYKSSKMSCPRLEDSIIF